MVPRIARLNDAGQPPYFFMAEDMDISVEIFSYYKFIILVEGELEVYGYGENVKKLREGDAIITPTDVTVRMKTRVGAVFTEIAIKREDTQLVG